MQIARDQLVTLLTEGYQDAVDRQLNNDADRVFAGRMAIRMKAAAARIKELEAEVAARSWDGYVDRQSGAFTQEEIARARGDGWT